MIAMGNAYERLGIIPIKDVLPYVVSTRKSRQPTEREYLGEKVWMNSARYKLLATKGITYVACGLKGQYFALERYAKHNSRRYHLNLYGVNDDGDEIMFTKDHIVPRSRGGTNRADNFQVLCKRCNQLKGNGVD